MTDLARVRAYLEERKRWPMELHIDVAVDVHGLDALMAAAEDGEVLRLVMPWEWPDPNPMPRLGWRARRPS